MEDLTDIKHLWMTADVRGLPGAGEVLKTIRRYRLIHTLKSLGFVLLALLLGAVMVWTVLAYHSHLLTTRIGEVCFLITVLILVLYNSNTLRRMSRQKGFTNMDFIRFLKEEQERQLYFYRRTQIIGGLISSAGLLLYLFELLYHSPQLMIIMYLLAFLWIAFCWFYIRPLAMRRRTRKLNETISRLEALSQQLNTE